MVQALVQCVASMSMVPDVLDISMDRIKRLPPVEVAAIIDNRQTMMMTSVRPDIY